MYGNVHGTPSFFDTQYEQCVRVLLLLLLCVVAINIHEDYREEWG